MRSPPTLGAVPGRVELSPSTWRQPWPPPFNEHRDRTLAVVAARIETLGARRVRVAIDGRTAAGKTTLGHELVRVLAENGRVVLRASLDDFKRPWSERHLYDRTTGEGYYRNAYDFEAITAQLLEPAAPTGSGQVALCSIDPLTQINHSDKRVSMPGDGILIVDSVFAFRPELNDHWDLRIWVEIDAELSVRRGTQRDAPREGAETAEALHRERYGGAEAVYITEVDPVALADVIVDNSDFDQPRLVRSCRRRSRRAHDSGRGYGARCHPRPVRHFEGGARGNASAR